MLNLGVSLKAGLERFKSFLEARLTVFLKVPVCCVSHSFQILIVADTSPNSNDQSSYVELKTNRIFDHPGQEVNFEKHKLLRVWAQSYLLGIPKVIFGFRDDDGILKELKEYSTQSIWERVKPKGYWNRHTCLVFAEKMLEEIWRTVMDNDREQVYMLRKEGSRILLDKLPRDSGRSFLPDWYWCNLCS